MTELEDVDRKLEDYESDLRFGEPSPKPKARDYDEARDKDEEESRSYKDNSLAGITVNRQVARKEQAKDKSFDSPAIEKKG